MPAGPPPTMQQSTMSGPASSVSATLAFMSTAFLVAGAVFAGIAAVLHVLIFLLESVLWKRPQTWRRFGVPSQGDAEILRPMALNHGFYNLFLAIGTGVGLVLLTREDLFPAGAAVVLFALLSMLSAAIVLISSNRKLARAAVLQGTAPLLGSVLLLLAIAIG